MRQTKKHKGGEMKLNGLAKVITEKDVEGQLTIIIEREDDRKFLFKRIKRLQGKNLVAYYTAARTYGDPNLAAAIRDNIFCRYVSG